MFALVGLAVMLVAQGAYLVSLAVRRPIALTPLDLLVVAGGLGAAAGWLVRGRVRLLSDPPGQLRGGSPGFAGRGAEGPLKDAIGVRHPDGPSVAELLAAAAALPS